jgi:4-alpha-glucanotransferase
MILKRSSGILCHISSLPSAYGIGDCGPEACRFADLLHRSRQRYWQVLPLNPVDAALGHSPYSSCSAFGANTLLISPELLYRGGLLTRQDLEACRLPGAGNVPFEEVHDRKAWMIARAYAAYKRQWFKSRAFDDFCAAERAWLDDHALFVVIKRRMQHAGWFEWPVELRDRHPRALEVIQGELAEELRQEKFAQFVFYHQWHGLKRHCRRRGIGLVGDIPIYVNYDSMDVWRAPGFFKLDKDRRPVVVAGVPPDYFSKDGQRWGNPVYNWDALKKDGFSWWIERLRHELKLFDLVRIDHFRGFAQCWEIPASEPTAVRGAWRDVPGEALFEAVRKEFPSMPIIAEDLGVITPDVDALKEKFGLPGMHVLMFAFHNEYKKSRDLPENSTPLSVVYTGTHDNNTIRGWFTHDVTPVEKKNMREYFGRDITLDEVNWAMIELAMRSQAALALIPLQDILGLGTEARMNTPSTPQGNWRWRMTPGAFTPELMRRLSALTAKAGR